MLNYQSIIVEYESVTSTDHYDEIYVNLHFDHSIYRPMCTHMGYKLSHGLKKTYNGFDFAAILWTENKMAMETSSKEALLSFSPRLNLRCKILNLMILSCFCIWSMLKRIRETRWTWNCREKCFAFNLSSLAQNLVFHRLLLSLTRFNARLSHLIAILLKHQYRRAVNKYLQMLISHKCIIDRKPISKLFNNLSNTSKEGESASKKLTLNWRCF